MAWLFSCFRCKQKRQCRSSSADGNCKIAIENTVLRNAIVLEAQDVVQEERVHSYTSLEQSLDASKQGNDADRSLFSLLKTETTCHSPKKQLPDQPLEQEGLQQVIDEFKKVKDLQDEANDFQNLLDSPNNIRKAFHDLHVDLEESQAEKSRHMARLHSLLTKIECEGKTIVLDDSTLQEQNKLDCNSGVDMGEPLLSSSKNESQQCNIEVSKEFCDSLSRFSPAALKKSNLEEETDFISPIKNLLERTFQNSRGCSSEIKLKQSGWRRDGSFESTPQTIEEPLLVSRSKRSSKALSFSEFSLVEAAAGSKLTSKKVELGEFERTESSVSIKTNSIDRVAALTSDTDDQITRKLNANVSGSPSTSSEQAISFSVSPGVSLYDTDMEVDSKAVKPYFNENSHGSRHGYVQTLENNVHAVPLCSDSAMEFSEAFTYEDSYTEISEASQFFTGCNSERKILDEEVDEPDIDQMSNCSDASYFLTSPLSQRLSERYKVFVRNKAHLQATPIASHMLQDSSAHCRKSKFDRELSSASTETAGGWMQRLSQDSLNLNTQMSFAEASSKEINLPVENRQFSASVADLVISDDKLLPSKLSDEVTSRPSRRFIDTSPESCTYSSIDHLREISSDEFASLEAASFSVPSPETVTSKIHMPSPSPLGSVKEASSTQRMMLNLPQETPSILRSVQEISCTNFLKQQPTPRTPSASSSQVETPNSIQSVVSPADLAKDRPIMGTVAAHWSHSSSKEKWDGKGIPNSTNKYKEDQKVSWHATPFEVRLERALAKQGRVFQKKLFGGNIPSEMELRTEPITSSG